MIANTEITLMVLLEHKRLMFQLIDHADSVGIKGTHEFSAALYYHLVGREIQGQSATEKKRLGAILSLDNLDRHGLLAYWDKASDTFIFQNFVIDMFRHLEGHRLQELTDAELNGLHGRLKEIAADVARPDFHWFREDVEFKERFRHVIGTMRDVNTRIEQNIISLKGQAKSLADLADQGMQGESYRTEQVHEALKRIFDLVERYIRPTLRFLNPDMDWKGKGNVPPLRLFSEVRDKFERRGFSAECAMMNRTYWNLIRAAEQITDVRRGLDVYVTLYEEQRKLYNAIEERYNEFYSKVEVLHDGRLKGNILDAGQALFNEMACLSGLKTYSAAQTALINFPRSPGPEYLDEYLRVKLDQVRSQKRSLLKAEDLPSAVEESDADQRRRFRLLYNAAGNITLLQGQDLYQQIHEDLKVALKDYSLADVIDAYSIAVMDKLEVKIDFQDRKILTHDAKQLNYFCRIWNGESLAND